MRNTQVTIIDIAKKLGISKSTVSRALRNHPDISQTTRDAVKKMAEELKYIPNTIASSFRNRKSKVIGLIMPQISYFFFPSVIQGIEKVVRSKGYNLMILQSDESYEREIENLNILLANNVEGILASVALETKQFDHYQYIIDIGMPIVFFDRVIKELDADIVLVDDISASMKAVTHLLEAGKRKIALCTGNMNLLISRNRLQGYKTALLEYGIPINENLILSCDSPKDAETAMIALLNSKNAPDAVFAISDLTMTGVMKAIFKQNLNVPTDISVIGFCEEPFRSMYNPQLTAIEPMGKEIGMKASELLFDRLDDSANTNMRSRIVYLDSNIVEGGSV